MDLAQSYCGIVATATRVKEVLDQKLLPACLFGGEHRFYAWTGAKWFFVLNLNGIAPYANLLCDCESLYATAWLCLTVSSAVH